MSTIFNNVINQENKDKFRSIHLWKVLYVIREYSYKINREYSWGICNAEDPNHSDLSLLQGLLSGYVCYEAVSQVHNCFYKDYFNKRKQEKNQVEEEKKKNVGMCALLALSLLGVFAIKQ